MGIMELIRTFGVVLVVGFAAVLYPGCSDEPSVSNSVGAPFIGTTTNLLIKTDTLTATASSTFKQYSVMNYKTDLIGNFGNFVAYTLVQFQALPQVDTVNVRSASLKFRAETWYGDSAATFAFNVHEISRSWTQTSFRWDSLGTDFFNPSFVHGTLNSSITADTEFITVSLDTTMVRRWLQSATSSGNFGVILVPVPGTNVVRGMHAFGVDADSLWPTLTIIGQGISSSTPDTFTTKFGQDTFVGNIDNLNPDPQLIYAQSGVVFRSRLTFDVSSIPRGAIISEAQLVLTPSLAATRLTKFTSDTSVMAHLSLSATDSSIFEATSARIAGSLPSGTFGGSIRHAVQYWVNNQSLNYGLILRANTSSEFNSPDVFAFFNQTAEPAKRPYLIIKYALQSN